MRTRHRLPATALLAIATLGAAAVQAHHSFAAMYDPAKPIRLTGKLTRVQWVNPHSNFELEVKGKDGQVQTWFVEGAGPGALSRRGFNKTDVKIGDTLVVDGYLARSGKRVIDGQRVTLPDGRSFESGSTGIGAAPGSATAPPATPATAPGPAAP
ncbi:MAG: DUF6152 family protein [Steroidobacteraceae bacterium]